MLYRSLKNWMVLSDGGRRPPGKPALRRINLSPVYPEKLHPNFHSQFQARKDMGKQMLLWENILELEFSVYTGLPHFQGLAAPLEL
jgi:hypothetical protein